MGWQFVPFVITPDELNNALNPFYLFVANARVPAEYTHTPVDVFLDNYSRLYRLLRSGEKINHRTHSGMLDYFAVTTDIDSVQWHGCKPPNEQYKISSGTSRGIAPYFMPYTFSVYEQNGKTCVSTRNSWMIESTSVMGLQLAFPKLSKSEAEYYGVSSEKDWGTYNDYKLFKDYISKHTELLRILVNKSDKRTHIYVSPEVKSALPEFHCIKCCGAEVI